MSNPTNEDRADRVYRHLLSYDNDNSNGDFETSITDMVADLCHLGDQYGDGMALLKTAMMHYAEEVVLGRPTPTPREKL